MSELEAVTTEPADNDTDELHTESAEAQQDNQAEQSAAQSVELEESEQPVEHNPQPAQRLEAQAEQEAEPPVKRGRGRPKKEEAAAPAPVPAPVQQPEPAKPVKPAKPAKPAKPKLPDLGAAVAPQLDAKRQQQLDAVKGLLQLQASKIASLACLAVGWEPLNAEESVLVDAEFDGWTPPEEMRKVVIVGIVALPRALADNRCRKLVGLPMLGAAGDAPAARAAEVAASVAPVPVEPPPPVQTAPQPAPQAATPAEEQRSDDLVQMVSPLFASAGSAKVPKGFM